MTFYRQLARESPHRFDVQESLAEVYHNLAVLCYQQERYREARVACREALAVRQNLIQAPGEQPDGQAVLGKCWTLLGLVEARLGHTQEAEPCFRQALGILQRLAIANFDNKVFHIDLAEVHNNFAVLLLLQNRLDEAEAHLWQALACIRGVSSKGQLASGSNFAASILESLARVQERRGNWSRVRSLLQESAQEANRSLQACPDSCAVWHLCYSVYTSWVLACARAEEWIAALEAATRPKNLARARARMLTQPPVLYHNAYRSSTRPIHCVPNKSRRSLTSTNAKRSVCCKRPSAQVCRILHCWIQACSRRCVSIPGSSSCTKACVKHDRTFEG